ncbi:hypothetical protein DYE49_03430 [Treponema rectale]|uniref:Uncharacterized protein n=1 Tax=Treponema rectale TaxID=744512 RepID=A0A7M1XL11_9SPIR|nr:hypothetical protein DYE49_03430 [Treponema rectale]
MLPVTLCLHKAMMEIIKEIKPTPKLQKKITKFKVRIAKTAMKNMATYTNVKAIATVTIVGVRFASSCSFILCIIQITQSCFNKIFMIIK